MAWARSTSTARRGRCCPECPSAISRHRRRLGRVTRQSCISPHRRPVSRPPASRSRFKLLTHYTSGHKRTGLAISKRVEGAALRHCLLCYLRCDWLLEVNTRHVHLAVRPGRRERRRIKEYTKPTGTRAK